jgi:hypothetical protein
LTAIYTSSYRAYQNAMGQAVVTSLGLPKWRIAEAREWPICDLLRPHWSYLRAGPEQFGHAYIAQLEHFGVCKIARSLERIAREREAQATVLLCHESRWEDCHRLTFAEFWLTTTGELVQEIN